MRISWAWVARCTATRSLVSASHRRWSPTAPRYALSIDHPAASVQCKYYTPSRQRASSTTSSRAPGHDGPGNPSSKDIPTEELSDEFDRSDPLWEDVLDRALTYGIRNEGILTFEADVGNLKDPRIRLIDVPAHRNDPGLWEILLVAQALRNGHEGIKAVWRGMRFRGRAIRFEGDEPLIETMWQIFLSAGSEDFRFLWALCDHSMRLGFKRPNLFAEIVGAALEGTEPLRAPSFVLLMGKWRYQGHKDLQAVFAAACRSKHPEALDGFCAVYDRVSSRPPLYQEITSSLWEQDRPDDAFKLHSFLISRGDLPSSFEPLEPFIHYLILQDQSLEKFLAPLRLAGASYEAQARRLWSRGRSKLTGMPSESLNVGTSKTLGRAPHKISDQFIARALATPAFSFDFAITSMRMVGLIEVGPLAVRQFAMTAPDLVTLQHRFQRLRELEVDLGASAFVRVVKNTCDAGRWEMVQLLVNNDLHHDVFEDLDLQKRLLTEYYRAEDWTQLNRTLVILNHGQFDRAAEGRAADLLLRSMMEAGDWKAAVNHAATLHERGLSISPTLPGYIGDVIQATDEFTFAKSTGMDGIAFLIGMLQSALASGTDFHIKHWRRPLRMLGQLRRLNEMESLIYWIAQWYTREAADAPASRSTISLGDPRDLNCLFDVKFQISLMAWCFRPRRGMKVVSPERCLRWTRVLKTLRDRYNVKVDEARIRWAFVFRMRYLFAPGMALQWHHASMRARNRTSVARFWQLYDQMWDMKPRRGLVNYDHRDKIVLYHHPMNRQQRRHRLSLLHKLRAKRADSARNRKKQPLEDVVVYRDLFNTSGVTDAR